MDEAPRPLVTLAVFAYNQERFVREATEAALSQTYSPLQIIISDDASTDSTFQIIQDTVARYDGPHHVVINRNDVNLGLAAHFSSILSRADGEIVVVAAGDDISASERTEKSVEIFLDHPDASIVSFRHRYVDERGAPLGDDPVAVPGRLTRVCLTDYLRGPRVPLSGASRALRTSIMEQFGPLNDSCPTEDTPMLLRGLMIGNAYLCDDLAISYRKHGANLSGPGSLPFLPHEEIYLQYMSDIETAERRGVLRGAAATEVRAWAATYRQRRMLERGLRSSDYSLRYFLQNMAASPALTVRMKCLHLRNVARRKLGRMKPA